MIVAMIDIPASAIPNPSCWFELPSSTKYHHSRTAHIHILLIILITPRGLENTNSLRIIIATYTGDPKKYAENIFWPYLSLRPK